MPPLTDPVFDLKDLSQKGGAEFGKDKGGEEFLNVFKDMLGNARYHQHLALTDAGMAAEYANTFKKMLQTADQANGTTVCQEPVCPGCRLMPQSTPSCSCMAAAISLKPSWSVGTSS